MNAVGADGKSLSTDQAVDAAVKGKPLSVTVNGTHEYAVDAKTRNGKPVKFRVGITGDGTQQEKTPAQAKPAGPEPTQDELAWQRRVSSGRMNVDDIVDTIDSAGSMSGGFDGLAGNMRTSFANSVSRLTPEQSMQVLEHVGKAKAEGVIGAKDADMFESMLVGNLERAQRNAGYTQAQSTYFANPAVEKSHLLTRLIEDSPKWRGGIGSGQYEEETILGRYNSLAMSSPERANEYAAKAARDIIRLRMRSAENEAMQRALGKDPKMLLDRGLGGAKLTPEDMLKALGLTRKTMPMKDTARSVWVKGRAPHSGRYVTQKGSEPDYEALKKMYYDMVRSKAVAPFQDMYQEAEQALAQAIAERKAELQFATN